MVMSGPLCPLSSLVPHFNLQIPFLQPLETLAPLWSKSVLLNLVFYYHSFASPFCSLSSSLSTMDVLFVYLLWPFEGLQTTVIVKICPLQESVLLPWWLSG